MVVTPEYVLAPDKTKLPAPDLVSPPVPPKMAEMVVVPELLLTV